MAKHSPPQVQLPDAFNHAAATRACSACLVLSKDRKIVLQLRDNNAPTSPGRLALFGGGIEHDESPMQALIRELREELGAIVKAPEVVSLGALTEEETHHHVLIHVYFWHDKSGTINGCYEGKAIYFHDAAQAERHPKLMEDVRWLLQECRRRKLLD